MKHKIQGFSLIEMLVAIVIAGIVLSAVLASYFSLLQASQKADVSRQLQREINFAMIRMADKVRSYSIDYGLYQSEGIDITHSQFLFTKGTANTSHVFSLQEFPSAHGNFTTLAMDGAPLFSPLFTLDEVNFSVTPHADPTDPENLGEKSVQLQPKATIFLQVKSLRYPDISFALQTTISSRRYE